MATGSTFGSPICPDRVLLGPGVPKDGSRLGCCCPCEITGAGPIFCPLTTIALGKTAPIGGATHAFVVGTGPVVLGVVIRQQNILAMCDLVVLIPLPTYPDGHLTLLSSLIATSTHVEVVSGTTFESLSRSSLEQPTRNPELVSTLVITVFASQFTTDEDSCPQSEFPVRSTLSPSISPFPQINLRSCLPFLYFSPVTTTFGAQFNSSEALINTKCIMRYYSNQASPLSNNFVTQMRLTILYFTL
eukprot:NODE_649_length_5036_cov_1.140571.p3 type:complete len:245 gc:universal NODE_649_length_5036_cov_1.140571:912-178(-)